MRFVPTLVVSALLATAAVPACSQPTSTTGAASASASAAASAAAPLDEVEAFFQDERAALTPPVYEKLVLALTECKLTDTGLDPRCPANEKLRRARSRNTVLKDLAGLNAAIGKKLLEHENASVRYQAATMMQSLFGADPSAQKLVVDATRKEKEPTVLVALLRVIGSKVREADVRAVLLEMAEHSNENVRKEALGWFVTSFAEGVEGTFDKVLEKLDKDPSEAVRAYLCDRLYGSGDERALPAFKKYLTAKDTPKKLYAGCWNGVIKTWTGFPQPKKPAKEGFELTMKLLEQKPRDQEHPPWAGLSTLRAAKDEFPATDKFGSEWLEKVKPWYKKARVIKALEEIATDTKANWMARTGALSVMHELGAPKATFEKLAKKYKDAKAGDDLHVQRRLADIIARLSGGPAAAPGASAPPPGVLPRMPAAPPGGAPPPSPH